MLINFFLFLSLLFLFSGLALDAGILQLRRLQLQHAADAAALGALYERLRGNAGWVAAGKSDAGLNGFTDGVNGVTITIQSPPTSGTYSGDATAIQAQVSQSYHTAFMGLIGGGANATPGTMAVSRPAASADCIYILSSGNGYYPLLIQSSSTFTSACSIFNQSTNKNIENDSGNALSVTGGNPIKVQGTSTGALLSGTTSPYPTFNSANENDPLADVAAPTFSACTYTSKSLANVTTTLSPGTYCNGLTLNNAKVTLQPGLYIITGGMNWSNNSTVAGAGVTLYLTQGGGYGYNYVSIANTTMTLSAPTSTSGGGITGILAFGDRGAVAAGLQGIQITNSTLNGDGIWYVLNTGIYLGSTTLKATNYLGIVTENLKLSGSTVTVPSPNYSSLSGGSPYAGSSTGGIVQ